MKITRRQLNSIIEQTLFGEKTNLHEIKILGTIKKLFKTMGNKKKFDKIEDESFPALYFDRFDDYTKEIAKKNYEKMRKEGTLEKTGLNKDLKSGSKGMKTEALLISYLLVGHKDFEGMTQPQIQKKLHNTLVSQSVHKVESESNMSDKVYKRVTGDTVSSSMKQVHDNIGSVENALTGQVGLNDSKMLDFKVNDTKFNIFMRVNRIDNLQAYDYGMIPKEGKGKSVLTASLTVKFDDNRFDIDHLKGHGDAANSEKKRAELNKIDGLHLNGKKVYSYNLDGSSGSSDSGAYESFVGEIREKLNGINFDDESKNTVIAAFEECLEKIGFDPSVFNKESKSNRSKFLSKIKAKIPHFGLKPRNLKESKSRQVASNAELYRKRYARRYR